MSRIDFDAPDLFRWGPVVEVVLTVDEGTAELLRLNGLPVPARRTLKALIDTGASGTAVRGSILRGLGIHPIAPATYQTMYTAATESARYPVRLVFPGGVFHDCSAIAHDEMIDHVDCLVGRDFLRRVTFVYRGPENGFTLEVPDRQG